MQSRTADNGNSVNVARQPLFFRLEKIKWHQSPLCLHHLLPSSHRESVKTREGERENTFLVLGSERGREFWGFLVLGLNKFISCLNETSNVEKFCLSGGDECMFQPHIKQY